MKCHLSLLTIVRRIDRTLSSAYACTFSICFRTLGDVKPADIVDVASSSFNCVGITLANMLYSLTYKQKACLIGLSVVVVGYVATKGKQKQVRLVGER